MPLRSEGAILDQKAPEPPKKRLASLQTGRFRNDRLATGVFRRPTSERYYEAVRSRRCNRLKKTSEEREHAARRAEKGIDTSLGLGEAVTKLVYCALLVTDKLRRGE